MKKTIQERKFVGKFQGGDRFTLSNKGDKK